MAIKIKIKQKEDQSIKLRIGDWVLITSKPLTSYGQQKSYVCVIAQTNQGIIKLIFIGEGEANRMNNEEINITTNIEGFLSENCIKQLFLRYDFQKLDVDITATVI